MNSIWIDTFPKILNKSKSLSSKINADVCIIGGGIAGIATAYELALAGLKIVILEKGNLASQASGNTTAKITSNHGLFYSYLINSYSINFAKDYLFANQYAIDTIEKNINREKIDCDFERKDSYIFASSLNDLSKIEDEVSSVNLLGFPAEFVSNPPLNVKNYRFNKISFPSSIPPTKISCWLMQCNYKKFWSNL